VICQRREKEPRNHLKSYLNSQLENAIKRNALRWNCSESWVIATALAAFYGVDILKPNEVKQKKTIIKFRKRA
jgi:hypothetical protein